MESHKKHFFNKLNTSSPKAQKLLIFAYVFLGLLMTYHLYFAHRIIPGVKVGNTFVGGKTYEAAKKALEKSESSIDNNVPLSFEDKVYLFKGEDVLLQYNWDAAVSRAYEVGRTGNILVDTKDKVAGLVKPIYIAAFYDYDEDLFHTRFAQLKGEINLEGANATFNIPAPGQIDIQEAVVGRHVASNDLFKILINAYDRMSFDEKVLPVEKSVPTIYKRDVEDLLVQAKKIIYNPLVVTFGTRRWSLDSKQMLEFLTAEKENDTVTLALNSPKFEGFLEKLGQEVNQAPRGKVTQTDGTRVVKFEITQAGREIDAKKFTKEFKTAYISALPKVEISLADMDIPTDTEKYGIFAELSEGTSRFDGSSRARINNLTLASERTDGVLVPPGGIYSMNSSIGEISGRTGYDTALIISGGRTVLGEGGGVCQTSTTMFRAALKAGLPIVMRYPHAYRVHYYEEDGPPGLDASIFQPTLDFQFKNDTPNYILVQTSVDAPNLSLSYKIYGTPDGRTVEMTTPVINSQSAPPAPLEIEDPTLAKGVRIQSDWSAWGANVSFNRTVKKGDEVLHTETFATRYQPWRAIFRVGTKE